MKRKLLSSLLVLSLVLSLSAVCTPQAYAANTIYSSDIVSIANELAGKKYPYVWGGRSPSDGGFDCTGLVYYIYHTRLGYNMTVEQSVSKAKLLAMGTKITNKANLLPGDIIQYTISHVGIYIGNNTVIHAGSSKGVVKISINTSGLTFSYGIRLPNVIQGSNPNGNGNSSTPPTSTDNKPNTSKPSITYADCNVEIICFNGQTVNLYNNPGDTSRITYFSKGQAPRSTYRATLSDGSVWYRVNAYHNGSDRTFWLKYESSKMTVTPIKTVHTIHFNANGGSVSTSYKHATAGETYGDLPTPTRSGYTFDGWYTATSGGTKVTSSTTVNLSSEQITLYAHWTQNKVSAWGNWSNWSTTPVSPSSTREVETRQVQVSERRTEYRYGRYVDSTGTHDCWCSKYLEGLKGVTGSAILDYSNWTTRQYSPVRPHWTCGFCKGNHSNVDHYSSDGRAWWKQYILPNGSYYWEEVRTVDAVYEMQYRYRDLMN